MLPEHGFRQGGHHAVDAIAEYYQSVRDLPANPKLNRTKTLQSFAQTIGEQGLGIEQAVTELCARLFDESVSMSHPLYLGLVNSSPLPAAVIGDMLVSSIDNNCGAFHQGPLLAGSERELIRWLGETIGYPAYGMVLPGGSYANFHALNLARTHHFPQWHEQGPAAVRRPPMVYIADSSHFSIHRAIVALGLGKQAIRTIATDERGAMDWRQLEHSIAEDRASGNEPFALVLNVGTTGTGAIDAIRPAVSIAEDYELWTHVDACYGGAVALLPELQQHLAGIDRVDSVAIDLHKWFFMPLIAGVALTKHESLSKQTYQTGNSYIPDGGHLEAYQCGLPTSRRGTPLAIWLALRAHGTQVIRDTIRRNIELTRYLETQLQQRGFRVLERGELSIACARWESSSMTPEELDQFQIDLSQAIRDDGEAWFATTRHQDHTWLRFNMVNLRTEQADIDRLVGLLTRKVGELPVKTPR